MNNRSSVAGLLLVVLIVAGLACRWESWDYKDSSGVPVFRYRGVLLPWQEAQAPPAGVAVSSVTVEKWSYYGLNRFDYTGAPGALTGPTGRPGQPASR